VGESPSRYFSYHADGSPGLGPAARDRGRDSSNRDIFEAFKYSSCDGHPGASPAALASAGDAELVLGAGPRRTSTSDPTLPYGAGVGIGVGEGGGREGGPLSPISTRHHKAKAGAGAGGGAGGGALQPLDGDGADSTAVTQPAASSAPAPGSGQKKSYSSLGIAIPASSAPAPGSGQKKSYSSLGIAIPPPVDTGSEDLGPRATPGHGLFADTPGAFIARGALSILESPDGQAGAGAGRAAAARAAMNGPQTE
jgi:hypothetical protein